jgi:hypothetical protein
MYCRNLQTCSQYRVIYWRQSQARLLCSYCRFLYVKPICIHIVCKKKQSKYYDYIFFHFLFFRKLKTQKIIKPKIQPIKKRLKKEGMKEKNKKSAFVVMFSKISHIYFFYGGGGRVETAPIYTKRGRQKEKPHCPPLFFKTQNLVASPR